jgi:glucose-6-phosphate 1-dehydrogenase
MSNAAKACDFAIFGVLGDLSRRKLIPVSNSVSLPTAYAKPCTLLSKSLWIQMW